MFIVEVVQKVKVIIDDDLVDDEFNKVFSDVIYRVDDSSGHAEHLAEMEAKGLIGFDKFVEGYGDIRQYGISVDVIDTMTEIVSFEDAEG